MLRKSSHFRAASSSVAVAAATSATTTSSSNQQQQKRSKTSSSNTNNVQTTSNNKKKNVVSSSNNNINNSNAYFYLQRLSPFQLSQQQPYNWLFLATVERGCSAEGVRLLSGHPDAPSPSELFSELSKHCQLPLTAVLVLLDRAIEYGDKILTVQYQKQQSLQQQQQQASAMLSLPSSNEVTKEVEKNEVSLILESNNNNASKNAVLDFILAATPNNNHFNSATILQGESASTKNSTTVDISTPASAANYAKTQKSIQLLRFWDEIQKFPSLLIVTSLSNTSSSSSSSNSNSSIDSNSNANTLLKTFCLQFLSLGLISKACQVLKMIPNSNVEFDLWESLLKASANGRLKDTEILWNLIQLPQQYLEKLMKQSSSSSSSSSSSGSVFDFVNSTKESSLIDQNIRQLLSSSSTAVTANENNNNTLTSLLFNNAIASNSNNNANNNNNNNHDTNSAFCFPSAWRVSLELCSHLLANQGGRSIPILSATHVMLRYLETDGKSMCHPVPVMAFFNAIIQQRSGGRHCVHWMVPWRIFQRLNATNPLWFKLHATQEESEMLVKNLIEILASGAPPQMAFNVARIASRFGVVDGVDIALHLLNRFNAAQQKQQQPQMQSVNVSIHNNKEKLEQELLQKSEVEKIVAKVYGWLTDVVQIHKRKSRHGSVILTARVLIRFGMTRELTDLYSKVLDQASDVDPQTRSRLLSVMSDLVCPDCCSILSNFNVHQDRTCDTCMSTVPAKPLTERSSFELTQGYLKRVREKRKQRRQTTSNMLKQSLSRQKEERILQLTQAERDARMRNNNINNTLTSSSSSPSLLDPAELIRLQITAPLSATVQGDIFLGLLQDGAGQDLALSSSSWDPNSKFSEALRSISDSADSQDNNKNNILLAVPQQRREINRGTKKSSSSLLEFEILSAEAARKQEEIAIKQGPVPWLCLWCNELNTPASFNDTGDVGLHSCCACGADTGPAARWRFNSSNEANNNKNNNNNDLDHDEIFQRSNNNNNESEYQKDTDDLYSTSRKNRSAARNEIKQKIRHALRTKELDDMVAASYFLLMYRKMFLLSADASRGDFVLVQTLIELLVDAQEKTLAACLFMRALPATIRINFASVVFEQQQQQHKPKIIIHESASELVQKLSGLFTLQGSAPAHVFNEEENVAQMLRDEKYFFSAVFGAGTCEHCFGTHASKECAIVTRKFAKSTTSSTSEEDTTTSATFQTKTLRTSNDEKMHLSISAVTHIIDSLKPNAATEPEVIHAYHRFVVSQNRELVATTSHAQANSLARHLCRVGFPKRAAFVICHIPLEWRSNEALTQLAGWFDLSPEDISTLLKNRIIGDATKSQHPNVIQLTRYCCVCFNGQHASHNCPRMLEWFNDAIGKKATTNEIDNNNNNAGGQKSGEEISHQQQPRISPKKDSAARTLQVNGWVSSGPERLYALYRFLLAKIDEIADLKKEPIELTHALNSAIRRLVETNQKSAAWRLFSRSNPSSLRRETIAKVLVMNGVEEMLVEEMLKDSTVGSEWLQLAVPPTACLICFDTGHSFQVCPELTNKTSTVEAALLVLQHVAKHRCAPARGVAAAADFIHHLYICGSISSETFHRQTALAAPMVALAHNCFQFGMSVRGYQIMRRLPYSAITPQLVISYWQSAGIADKIIYGELEPKLVQYLQKATQAAQAKDEYFIAKRQAQQQGQGNNNNNNSNPEEISQIKRRLHEATKEYHTFVEGPTCRHCYSAGHSILECKLILNESEFGRDLLSIFRVLMADSRFSPDEGKRLLIHLVQYLVHHHRHLPFHVIGVSRAMNSLAVLMTMLQMPGLGLRLLLSIPPAYRQRHVYEHLLQGFGVSSAETQRRCEEYLQGCIDASDGFAMTIPDSLLFVCPPMQDVAMSHVFAGILPVGKVQAALQEADRMLAEDPNEIVHVKTGQVVLASCYDPRRPPQAIDIGELKEAVDPLQRFVEERVEMQIGSRHDIFTKVIELVEGTDGDDDEDDEGEDDGNNNDHDANGKEEQEK